MNNQYRVKANTDPVLAWFELRRKLWGTRAETESAQAAHKSLDELIRPSKEAVDPQIRRSTQPGRAQLADDSACPRPAQHPPSERL